MINNSSFAASLGINACNIGHSYSNITTGFTNVYLIVYSTSDHDSVGMRILENHMNRPNDNWLSHIKGGEEGFGVHSGCSRISNEEASAKPIPTTFGRSVPLEIYDCNCGTRQVTICVPDDMYNINSIVTYDFLNQSHFS